MHEDPQWWVTYVGSGHLWSIEPIPLCGTFVGYGADPTLRDIYTRELTAKGWRGA